MVRIIGKAQTQARYETEKMVQEMFMSMFHSTHSNECNTSLFKISCCRKLYRGLLDNLEIPSLAQKKKEARRLILRKRIAQYFKSVAKDREAQKDRFWENYPYYEEVIRKSFNYIYRRRCPNFNMEDEKESYNELLVALENQDVFNIKKFDPDQYEKQDVPIGKRYEHYLFNRVYSYLSREYNERKKRTIKFRRVSEINDIHTGSFNPKLEPFEEEPRIDVDLLTKDQRKKELEHQEELHKDAVASHIPFPTSGIPTPAEELEEMDLWQTILSACRTEQERQIVSYKKEGITNEDIGKLISCTGSNVAVLISRVRSRLQDDLIAA
jgi:hypothetical protein